MGGDRRDGHGTEGELGQESRGQLSRGTGPKANTPPHAQGGGQSPPATKLGPPQEPEQRPMAMVVDVRLSKPLGVTNTQPAHASACADLTSSTSIQSAMRGKRSRVIAVGYQITVLTELPNLHPSVPT